MAEMDLTLRSTMRGEDKKQGANQIAAHLVASVYNLLPIAKLTTAA